MKTSFNNVVETEEFLRGAMPAQDALLFEARLLLDEELKTNTFFHRTVHRLVRLYGRKKTKAEVESVHARLFNDPCKSAFRESIFRIFNT